MSKALQLARYTPRHGSSTPGGDPGGTDLHPFKVVTQIDAATGTSSVAVYQGQLFQSLRPDDRVAIPGLTLITATTPSWFDLSSTDLIWLTISFAANSAPSVTLNSLGKSDTFNYTEDAWSGNDGFCEDDGSGPNAPQKTLRVPLAFFFPDGDGAPQLSDVNGAKVEVQSVTTDLLLRDACLNGRPAQIALPR